MIVAPCPLSGWLPSGPRQHLVLADWRMSRARCHRPLPQPFASSPSYEPAATRGR
jgi:hypothetical protein